MAGCTAAIAVAGAFLSAGTAPGQDLLEQLNQTQEQLSQANSQEGVLTTKIEHESAQIDSLQQEVAELQQRLVVLEAELAQKQLELDQAEAQLDALKSQLRQAIKILEERLIAMYKSSEPDALTVILRSDGFDDLLERTEYVQELQEQDDAIVGQVRGLRDQMQVTVSSITAARDAIAAQKAELDATEAKLQTRTGELAVARRQQRKTLDDVRTRQKDLEGDLSDISEKIAEQLGGGAAGPIRIGAGGLIWPVNGPIVSGFGMRWGRMHEGVDIAVPTGTPIRAARTGTVRIAGSMGGYGNYTCIDHGGGLSTCYAHQTQILVSVGQAVAQAQVIGTVGCTGHCFGPHVHFEVRINGQAVDPLGYL